MALADDPAVDYALSYVLDALAEGGAVDREELCARMATLMFNEMMRGGDAGLLSDALAEGQRRGLIWSDGRLYSRLRAAGGLPTDLL